MNIAAAWVSEPWFNLVVTKPLHNHVALASSHWFVTEKTKAWAVSLIVTPQTPYKSSTDSLKTKALGTKRQKLFTKKRQKIHQNHSCYLLPSSDGICLSLDYNVLCATNEHSRCSKRSRLSKQLSMPLISSGFKPSSKTKIILKR